MSVALFDLINNWDLGYYGGDEERFVDHLSDYIFVNEILLENNLIQST